MLPRARRPLESPPRGFTLIELIVVTVIAAIVIAFAMPDMRRMINENRMASEANAMLGVLTYARSEALRRNRPVAVCMSTNGTSCATTAPTAGYAAGVIVFENNSGATSSAMTMGTGDTVLRVTVPVASGTRIVGGTGLSPGLVFNPGGDTPLGGPGFLFVLPLGTPPANSCQRLVELMPIGRARVMPAVYTSGTVTDFASYALNASCGVAG